MTGEPRCVTQKGHRHHEWDRQQAGAGSETICEMENRLGSGRRFGNCQASADRNQRREFHPVAALPFRLVQREIRGVQQPLRGRHPVAGA